MWEYISNDRTLFGGTNISGFKAGRITVSYDIKTLFVNISTASSTLIFRKVFDRVCGILCKNFNRREPCSNPRSDVQELSETSTIQLSFKTVGVRQRQLFAMLKLLENIIQLTHHAIITPTSVEGLVAICTFQTTIMV